MILFYIIKLCYKDKEYRDLLLTAAFILVLGMVVYHYIEGWTWLDAFYFSFITLTTIGFGDFAPQTDIGKIFTIIYTMVGISIILAFINTFYQHYNKQKRRRK
ncbi:MAG: two pore domain potassium channel family protein [Ekhidna sp.]|nr:two pore domain potassium channel family protein [Ekhidna sp.]MBC6411045.1 two pore domain potassium channel family protein [Ekhidna sp.]MBC6426238.1 two pore domain potassium channel family protein [Ekhidna sp.]